MPTYDYHCAANGRVVEVQHTLAESVATWGALCARAGIDRGSTPANAKVTRLITGGHVLPATSLGSARERPCDSGNCATPRCGTGPCGGF